MESPQKSRESDGEDCSPEEASSHSPSHANLTMGQGKDFRRVGEGYGTFTWRVESGEEEDEEGDHTEMRARIFRNEEAQSCSEKGPGHLREGEEEESAATPGIDCPDGGPGEDEIYETETEGGEKSFQVTCTGFAEDGGRVESDDVNTTHLLGQHDSEGSASGTTYTRNSEELDEACDIVASADDVCLLLDLSVDVIEIASSLERGIAESAKRSEGIRVSTLFDIPSRRFWAEINADQERDRRNHS